MTYTTREPLEKMLILNKNEDISKIEDLFNELEKDGFTFFQWSSFSSPIEKPGAYDKYTHWLNGRKSDVDLMIEWQENHAGYTWFFIEAFGPQFLRGEGETFFDCIQQIQKQWREQTLCTEHTWAYTHHNGHKTCSNCGHFAPCSVEEALTNYQSGSVEIDKHHSLQFDHEKPLCSCGSHRKIYFHDSFFPEKTYFCENCNSWLPIEKMYEKMHGTDVSASMNRLVVFSKGKKISENRANQIVQRFLDKMLRHFIFIEKKEESYTIDEFSSWIYPYLQQFVEIWNPYLVYNEQTYKITQISVSDLIVKEHKLFSFHCSYNGILSSEQPDGEQTSFQNTISEIVHSFKDK